MRHADAPRPPLGISLGSSLRISPAIRLGTGLRISPATSLKTRRAVSRAGRIALIGVLILVRQAALEAQDRPGGRFSTGPVTWSPTISLRDAGIDSNIYDQSVDPREDRMAILTPQLDVVLDSPHFKLQGTGVVDVVYFERHAGERTINRKVVMRAELPFSRLAPFVTGTYERAHDRQGFEVDLRADREAVSGGLGVLWSVTPRGALRVTASQGDNTYDAGQTFRGLDLARELSRTTQTATLGFQYTLSPFTTLTFDVSGGRERYRKSSRDSQDVRALIGVTFAPDAIVRGHAAFGYHLLDTKSPQVPFKGFHADVGLGYTLLGVTRFDVRFGRDTGVSVDAPYFLQTDYGLEIQQTLFGPLFLLARGSRQLLDYPGIPQLLYDARIDRSETYGGGLAMQMTGAARATVTWEATRRLSTIALGNFSRQRLLSSFTFAF